MKNIYQIFYYFLILEQIVSYSSNLQIWYDSKIIDNQIKRSLQIKANLKDETEYIKHCQEHTSTFYNLEISEQVVNFNIEFYFKIEDEENEYLFQTFNTQKVLFYQQMQSNSIFQYLRPDNLKQFDDIKIQNVSLDLESQSVQYCRVLVNIQPTEKEGVENITVRLIIKTSNYQDVSQYFNFVQNDKSKTLNVFKQERGNNQNLTSITTYEETKDVYFISQNLQKKFDIDSPVNILLNYKPQTELNCFQYKSDDSNFIVCQLGNFILAEYKNNIFTIFNNGKILSKSLLNIQDKPFMEVYFQKTQKNLIGPQKFTQGNLIILDYYMDKLSQSFISPVFKIQYDYKSLKTKIKWSLINASPHRNYLNIDSQNNQIQQPRTIYIKVEKNKNWTLEIIYKKNQRYLPKINCIINNPQFYFFENYLFSLYFMKQKQQVFEFIIYLDYENLKIMKRDQFSFFIEPDFLASKEVRMEKEQINFYNFMLNYLNQDSLNISIVLGFSVFKLSQRFVIFFYSNICYFYCTSTSLKIIVI